MSYSFIIVTPGRCGSEHLIETLRSYPDLQMHGEVFNRVNHGKDSFNHFLKSSRLRRALGVLFNREKLSVSRFNFPLQLLISSFLNQQFAQPTGFKLTLDQLYAYPFLFKKFPDLKVIYLGRENIPNLVFSLIKARKSGIYHTRSTSNDLKKYTFAPDEVYSLYDQIVQWEELLFVKMKNHPFLKITYESLFENYLETLRSIRSFLGLIEQDPPQISTIQKSHVGHPGDWITNYDEICTALAHRKKNRS